jgi:hypothetical protein
MTGDGHRLRSAGAPSGAHDRKSARVRSRSSPRSPHANARRLGAAPTALPWRRLVVNREVRLGAPKRAPAALRHADQIGHGVLRTRNGSSEPKARPREPGVVL